MSKGKTILKFSAAILLLGGSIATFVTYFPHITLAIQSGVVISIAPMVIFAISAIVALSSLIGLGVLTVSAIRSNGKSNEVVEKSRSESQDEERSLASEEEQVISNQSSIIVRHYGSQTDKTLSSEQCTQTDEVLLEGKLGDIPLPAFPNSSPLNSLDQSRSFPSLPPTANSIHNSYKGDGNPVQNHNTQTNILLAGELKIALPAFKIGRKRGRSETLHDISRLFRQSTCKENQEYESLPLNQITQYSNNLRRSQSLPNLKHTVTVEPQNVGEDQMDSVASWDTDWDCDDSLRLSLSYSEPSSMLPIIENADAVTANANTHLQQIESKQ